MYPRLPCATQASRSPASSAAAAQLDLPGTGSSVGGSSPPSGTFFPARFPEQQALQAEDSNRSVHYVSSPAGRTLSVRVREGLARGEVPKEILSSRVREAVSWGETPRSFRRQPKLSESLPADFMGGYSSSSSALPSSRSTPLVSLGLFASSSSVSNDGH